MARPGFYKILEYPLVYTAVNMILGPGGKRIEGNLYRRLFKDCRGLVLDIGCGPDLRTPQPDGTAEMGSSVADAVQRLRTKPAYAVEFAAAFDDGLTAANLAKALASTGGGVLPPPLCSNGLLCAWTCRGRCCCHPA